MWFRKELSSLAEVSLYIRPCSDLQNPIFPPTLKVSLFARSFFIFLLSPCSIPENATLFLSVLLYVKTGSASYPASCSMGNGILCPRVKRPGGRGWSWPPTFNSKVKNAWSYKCAPPIRPMVRIKMERQLYSFTSSSSRRLCLWFRYYLSYCCVYWAPSNQDRNHKATVNVTFGGPPNNANFFDASNENIGKS